MNIHFSDINLLWSELKPTLTLPLCLFVDVSQQKLKVYQFKELIRTYSISTALNGIGNEEGSYKTPSGFHEIDEKIGASEPINRVFKARQASDEIAKVNDTFYTANDSITSRILWLSGLQVGINLSGQVDTKKRYIYIHGTADEVHLGQAVSHGCIRMKNTDIIELFDIVDEKTIVYIS